MLPPFPLPLSFPLEHDRPLERLSSLEPLPGPAPNARHFLLDLAPLVLSPMPSLSSSPSSRTSSGLRPLLARALCRAFGLP